MASPSKKPKKSPKFKFTDLNSPPPLELDLNTPPPPPPPTPLSFPSSSPLPINSLDSNVNENKKPCFALSSGGLSVPSTDSSGHDHRPSSSELMKELAQNNNNNNKMTCKNFDGVFDLNLSIRDVSADDCPLPLESPPSQSCKLLPPLQERLPAELSNDDSKQKKKMASKNKKISNEVSNEDSKQKTKMDLEKPCNEVSDADQRVGADRLEERLPAEVSNEDSKQKKKMASKNKKPSNEVSDADPRGGDRHEKRLLPIDEEQIKKILIKVVYRNMTTCHATPLLKKALRLPDTFRDILSDYANVKIDSESVLEHVRGSLNLMTLKCRDSGTIEYKMAEVMNYLRSPLIGFDVDEDHYHINNLIGLVDPVLEIVNKVIKGRSVEKATEELIRYAREKI